MIGSEVATCTKSEKPKVTLRIDQKSTPVLEAGLLIDLPNLLTQSNSARVLIPHFQIFRKKGVKSSEPVPQRIQN